MNREVHNTNPFESKLALIVKIPATAYFVWLILNFFLGGLAVLVQMFNESIAVGIVLIVVGGIGLWLAFAGCFVALQGLIAVWTAFENVKNSYEYYAKVVGLVLALIVASYLAYMIGNALLALLGNWLSSFVN